jgi:hypothetical protein
MIQIAAKTGSAIWTITPQDGLPRSIMVIGMDVYHETKLKNKSVLGFTASIHPEFCKYYNEVKI